MSLGEYVLQVTPKKIEFKLPTNYVKVSTALSFGQLQHKSPYARFIRSLQGSFYGQRLKLNNHLNQQASFTVIGIDKLGEENAIAKIQLNVIGFADKEDPTEKTFENQQIKFEYEVLVFERQISDEDYEEILSNKGSDKQIDSQPILLNILSSDFQEKIGDSNLNEFKEKEIELPGTPRLRDELQEDTDIIDLKLDQSPIQTRIEPQSQLDSHPVPEPVRLRRSSLKAQSAILSPKSNNVISPKKSQSPVHGSHGSRVRFIQPPKQPKHSKYSLSNILLYTLVSGVSLYAGAWAKITLNS